MKQRMKWIAALALIAAAWIGVHLAAGDPISPASNRDYSWVQQIDPNHLAAATAAKNGDYVVTGIYEANFGPTSFSLADANCCATLASWPDNLVRIGITLYDSNMPQLRVTITGAASDASPVLQGVGIWTMPVTATVARTMQFYSSVSQKGTVYKMQPRN
jgi:hypothetical protein